MLRKFLMAVPVLALATVLTVTSAPEADARKGVKVGMLRCNVKGNASFVFGSSRALFCVYTPTGAGKREIYTGTIDKFGVDLGFISDGTMLWAVVAPAKQVKPGALAGTYGGVAASVAAGLGVGTNALVGGWKDTIALQPLSVEGLEGVNVAAGIARLKLQAADE